MSIEVKCFNPECGRDFRCPDEYAGKVVRCSVCRTEILVPTAIPADGQGEAPNIHQPAAEPAGSDARGLPPAPTMPHASRQTSGRSAKPKSRTALRLAIGAAVAILVAVGTLAVVQSGRTPSTSTHTTVLPVASISRSETSAGARQTELAEIFAYAQSYAQSHPQEFAEVLRKFEEVKRLGAGSIHAVKAEDEIRTWREKRDKAAESEFAKCLRAAGGHLELERFSEARSVWQGFPEALRTEAIERKIAGESSRIRDALEGFARELEGEAEPLLRKSPAELSPDDLKALEDLKARAENPPDGLTDAAVETLAALAEKVIAATDGHREALAEDRAKALGAIWRHYEGLMRDKKFAAAKAYLARAEENLDGELKAMLVADTQAIEDLFGRIEANLPQLKGKTVRLGGIGMPVSDVKGGRLYVKQGEAEMAFGIDKLDPDAQLSLGLSSEGTRQATAAQRALFTFYYGQPSDAVAALKGAAESGADMSFYMARMVPVLVVASRPPGAQVELQVLVDGNWRALDDRARTTPLREEVPKNTAFRLSIQKDGYAPLVREVRIGEGGECRAAVTLSRLREPTVYTEWPFGSEEAKRRQKATARALGIPVERNEDLGDDAPVTMILIPAGEFMMGSAEGEHGRNNGEGPRHRVRITQPFYLGKYEITQQQWSAVMGGNPRDQNAESLPVPAVSLYDCQAFIKKLNEKLPRAGRLHFSIPTEAQWEYACRAGTETPYCFGDDESRLEDYAWYGANSDRSYHPVGKKKANAWGLHDMHGNVWEWCQDWYEKYSSETAPDPSGPERGTHGLLRGGGWSNPPANCRSAARSAEPPNGRHYGCAGLRLCLRLRP